MRSATEIYPLSAIPQQLEMEFLRGLLQIYSVVLILSPQIKDLGRRPLQVTAYFHHKETLYYWCSYCQRDFQAKASVLPKLCSGCRHSLIQVDQPESTKVPIAPDPTKSKQQGAPVNQLAQDIMAVQRLRVEQAEDADGDDSNLPFPEAVIDSEESEEEVGGAAPVTFEIPGDFMDRVITKDTHVEPVPPVPAVPAVRLDPEDYRLRSEEFGRLMGMYAELKREEGQESIEHLEQFDLATINFKSKWNVDPLPQIQRFLKTPEQEQPKASEDPVGSQGDNVDPVNDPVIVDRNFRITPALPIFQDLVEREPDPEEFVDRNWLRDAKKRYPSAIVTQGETINADQLGQSVLLAMDMRREAYNRSYERGDS